MLSVDYLSLLEQMTKETTVDKSSIQRVLVETSTTEKASQPDLAALQIRNIFIWLPITLVVILYFTVTAITDMSFNKSSLLYAKYGSSKTSSNAQ